MNRPSRREARQGASSQMRTAAHHNRIPISARAEHDARKRRGRGKLKTVFSVLGVLLLLVIAAGAFFYIDLHSRMTVSDVPPSLLDTPTPPPTAPFNLVIFGSDARSPSDTDLTDTIIVARIDPIQQQIWMVSIPRDTRVELPGYGASRLNSAYVRGGPDMAIQAVEDVTGQDMDYFITINFWGFEEIVDAMGGIYIDVPFDINDPLADFTPDGRATHIDAGFQNLDGAHALTFVRHRDGYADGDFGRMRAQQQFFKALLEQMTDVPVARMPGVVDSLADNLKTNLTPLELAIVGVGMRGAGSDSLHATTLPGEWHAPFVAIDAAGADEIWRNFGTAPFEDAE